MIPVQFGVPLGDVLFFVPFVAILLIVVGFFAVLLYFDHKQEMALIESGQYDDVDRDSRAWILGGGLLVLAVGLGSVVSSALSGGPAEEGITAVFVGLAALAYYFYKRRAVAVDAPA